MVDWGLKISKAGEDVTSCDDDDLLISSEFPMFKVKNRDSTYLRMYKTTLSANINNVVTTIPLTSTTGIPSGMSVTGWIWIFTAGVAEAISYTTVGGSSVSGGARAYKGTAAANHNNGDTVIVGYNEFDETHGLAYPPVHFVWRDDGTYQYIVPEVLDVFGVNWIKAWVTTSKLYISVNYEDLNTVPGLVPAGVYNQYNFNYQYMYDSITTPYY